ncbi:hypothetical protein [Streptococcus suis]
MEAQSLGSHQHSWWFSFVFLYEKNWLEAIMKKKPAELISYRLKTKSLELIF